MGVSVKMGKSVLVTDDAGADAIAAELKQSMGEGWRVSFERTGLTMTQNKALHKGCEIMAGRLNDAGYDMQTTVRKFKQGIATPWTKESVKEILYKPVLKAMTGKVSTQDQDTKEPSQIWQVVAHRVSELTGIEQVPWPSRYDR